MSVDAVRFSANAFYVGYLSPTGSRPPRSAADKESAQGTTVNISKEGRQALDSEKAVQTERTSAQQATASVDQASVEAEVKKLAIAPWLSSYFPSLTPQIGMKATVVEDAYPKWFGATQDTRDEYSKLFFDHYNAVLKDSGIDNREKEYSMLVVDQKQSEQVHRRLFEELQADPKMARLMNELGMPSTAYRSYTAPKDWPSGSDPRNWMR